MAFHEIRNSGEFMYDTLCAVNACRNYYSMKNKSYYNKNPTMKSRVLIVNPLPIIQFYAQNIFRASPQKINLSFAF